MRRIDFKHQQRPDGGVNNRTDVPSPPHPTGEQPFADGHASCILKAYREALNHPDDSFLKEYWPHIKRAVEYLIGRDAAAHGGQPDGILRDDQWNTYDEALHGVTTFISGYYLAALRAGEEWARRMGDPAAAERFHAVFSKGQQNLVKLCWNGEYFQQDLPDYLKRSGRGRARLHGRPAHRPVVGAPARPGLPPAQGARCSRRLRAVFKYNWKSDLTGWKHSPRAFAGAKDKGLIDLHLAQGRPARPRDALFRRGLDRHRVPGGGAHDLRRDDRGRRSPSSRAPATATTASRARPSSAIRGTRSSAAATTPGRCRLGRCCWRSPAGNTTGRPSTCGLHPRWTPENFQSFFSGPEGWGSLRQVREGGTQHSEIAVVEGRLAVARLQVIGPAGAKSVKVTLGGKPLEASVQTDSEGTTVTLASPVTVEAGESLRGEYFVTPRRVARAARSPFAAADSRGLRRPGRRGSTTCTAISSGGGLP